MRMPADAEANKPVFDIDPAFGAMAVAMGQATWSVDGLSMREKALLCIVADSAIRDFGLAYEMHLQMAQANAVPISDIHEAILFSAMDGGHSNALGALARFNEITGWKSATDASGPAARETVDYLGDASDMDPELVGMWREPSRRFWTRPGLTLRERALLSIAINVLTQVLGAPFAHNVTIALKHGADDVALHALMRFLSEYGFARAWAASEALSVILARE